MPPNYKFVKSSSNASKDSGGGGGGGGGGGRTSGSDRDHHRGHPGGGGGHQSSKTGYLSKDVKVINDLIDDLSKLNEQAVAGQPVVQQQQPQPPKGVGPLEAPILAPPPNPSQPQHQPAASTASATRTAPKPAAPDTSLMIRRSGSGGGGGNPLMGDMVSGGGKSADPDARSYASTDTSVSDKPKLKEQVWQVFNNSLH